MTGRMIHRPRTHECSPGWTEYAITDSEIPELNGRTGLEPPSTSIPDGAIWECECGRTWVAYHPEYRNIVVLSPTFRPEGRLERWRRERRSVR